MQKKVKSNNNKDEAKGIITLLQDESHYTSRMDNVIQAFQDLRPVTENLNIRDWNHHHQVQQQ